MATTAPSTAPSTAVSSIWTAPKCVTSFYAKFPLIQYEQEEELQWKSQSRSSEAECSLWVHPSTSSEHPHHRSWASTNPSSLRAQLLFLLRDPPVRVTFRQWANEDSAPGGTLPALHVTDDSKLVASDDIRSWLDTTHPLKGKGKELQGLPTQEAYDQALAIAQLVLGRLLPAYLISLPKRQSNIHLYLPVPPMLSAGLTTPLPASLTGDSRNVDKEEIFDKGIEALDALETLLGTSDWALGASRPTPLDALIASHVYAIFSLESSSRLRGHVETKSTLDDYVERVMSHAGSKLI